MDAIEKKIRELGLELPPAPKPAGTYLPICAADRIACVSGQIARTPSGEILAGKVGGGLSLEEGQKAARIAALNALSLIREELGWDRVRQILRVVGYVQTAPNFYGISEVVNAASGIFLDVLGEAGRHARSAVGMASLPMNSAVELELTLALH